VIERYELLRGDCLTLLKAMADSSVDAIVTDPPYGLRFMGKAWDYDVPRVEVWVECLRVLKPGGHLLAFAGTRTQHRMAVRIEDAGFEIRDMIAWVYGSGFPKSKNLDGDWQGWGTALKPALEPITMARKPLVGSVASNVEQFGTGAINIGGCRVPSGADHEAKCVSVVGLASSRTSNAYGEWSGTRENSYNPSGRFPANLIHDGSDEVLARFPDSDGAGGSVPQTRVTGYGGGIGTGCSDYLGGDRTPFDSGSGSAARFFYCAKAGRHDRNEGCEALPHRPGGMVSNTSGRHITRRDEGYAPPPQGNHHPTVKPTDLMRYLVRLVTPRGGVVLDPYTGSGSTGKACMLEGFRFVGIERDEDEHGQPLGYLDIARARIEHAARFAAEASRQLDLLREV